MARSRNDRIRTRIGKAIINGTLSSAGTITASGVGTTLHANFDSSGALLNSDSAGYADGSLHYLSKLKKMYVWDDSDGQFFELTGLDSSAAEGSYSFQGSTSGYTSGGSIPAVDGTIDKFPFSSDANATDVGDLTVSRGSAAGQSSTSNGYASGGSPASNVIDKFPFTSDANATDVGDLTVARYTVTGQSSSDNGYVSGGRSAPGVRENIIDKFPFSTDANATDVGDLTDARSASAGNSSTTHGYSSGGIGPSAPPLAYSDIIDKFSFSSDANATDVGDLPIIGAYGAGQSSSDNGYVSGGSSPTIPGPHTNIYKFSFATDGNATDIADITEIKMKSAGQSSTSSGYVSGGQYPIPPFSNVIEKFPFSADANATDVGDLTLAKFNPTGQQV